MFLGKGHFITDPAFHTSRDSHSWLRINSEMSSQNILLAKDHFPLEQFENRC